MMRSIRGAFTPAIYEFATHRFTVTTVVRDPRYLRQPFVTTIDFKKEPNDAKWDPTPCQTRQKVCAMLACLFLSGPTRVRHVCRDARLGREGRGSAQWF
jgi:hypothetical protein